MNNRFETYQLTCEGGDTVVITNYGARICKWQVTLEDEARDIVIGYDDVERYLNDPYYLGAIVGPYANRIEDAQVLIDGIKIDLNANQAPHHLHGGKGSVSDIFWQCTRQTPDSVTLTCTQPDNHNGYPGPITFEVTYTLRSDIVIQSQLVIEFKVCAERKSVIGPTTHPYFNLSHDHAKIDGHQLQLHSSKVADYHQNSAIPSGTLLPVAGTRFDYKKPKVLRAFGSVAPLDHNFFIKEALSDALIEQGRLISPDEKLSLSVYSEYPCVQVYLGKDIKQVPPLFEAICLEPQFAPNSPNQLNFPYAAVEAGEVFEAKVVYQTDKL